MRRSSEKKHWDRYWASSAKVEDVYGTDARIVENLERHAKLGGSRVLEVGAGTGRDAREIASRGGSAVALDYSEESLKLMRSSVGERVDIVCGDAASLPFAAEAFDIVFHQGLLEHFRRPEAILDENLRVLKRGGVLLVDVPQKYHYYTLLKHLLMAFGKWFAGWETEYSAGALSRLIESRGAKVIGLYAHNQTPPIWYRALRRVFLKTGVRLPMYPRNPGWFASAKRLAASRFPESFRLNTSLVIGCVARKP